ncbi:MAG: 30S ribosomal protein S9 [Candidatus Aenigmatarchaeota archaeon]|nr:30S ribosomal protein S9 [Candidatus Aenigmarchaeota archaeon]
MVKKKEIHTIGKRRIAIARAVLRPGKGDIKINSVPLNLWGNEPLRMWIREPLILAGDISKTVDIDVNVRSGGIVGQAEAIRMAIAKALVEYSNGKELREKYLQYDRNLLVYDPRRNEPHHGSGRGASKRGSRRHRQRSKR